MRRQSIAQALRSLGSVSGLLLLLAGPPTLLVRLVGSPIPTRIPTVTEILDVLGGSRVDDGILVGALALVCWVAWLQVVASTLTEADALRRGRSARRLPLGGMVQPVVRHLVLSAVLLFGGIRMPQPIALAGTGSLVMVVHSPVSANVARFGRGEIPVAITSPLAASVVVKERDCLWSLAEEYLGDGTRWRDLWDLNHGRVFSDGRTLADPDLIHPGWVLDLPPDVAASGVGTPVARIPANPQPMAPTSPLGPAPALMPTPHSTPATSSSGRIPPAPSTETPSTETPPTETPSTETPSTETPSTETPSTETPSTERPGRPAARLQSRPEVGIRTSIGLATGSLLAAGLVGTVDRFRRRQVRNRRPGHTVPVPAPAAAAVETALRVAADNAPTSRLDLVLRALAGSMAGASGPVPAIDVVTVGPEGIEVLLDSDLDAPHGPFVVSAEGRCWTMPASVPVDTLTATESQTSPTPAMVTVGTVGDRQVLIDLEAGPRTMVDGEMDTAGALVWSMACELATSGLADGVEVIVVGDAVPTLGRLERATVVTALAEVIERIERAAVGAEHELDLAGAASTMAVRVANPAEPWPPTVVLVTREDPGPDLARLLAAAQPGRGLAVVAVGSVPAGFDRELRIEGRFTELLPLGLTMDSVVLAPERLEALDDLLDSAISEEPGEELLRGIALRPESIGSGPDQSPPSGSTTERASTGQVTVRLLGGVDVVGGEQVIGRRRSLELVAYLALHPAGVNEGRLRTALWPEAAPSRENFNQTVSRARQPLGTAPDGTSHLPRLVEGAGSLYRLGPNVSSDVAALEAAYASVRAQASQEAIDVLVEALGLVRGIPFEGTMGGWEWVYSEGHAARCGVLAADAAHLVAQWALDAGDVQRAIWAAGQGLLASPGDEVLYRDRMLAHDLAGNRAGVEATMRELRRTVDDDEPYDSIHPDTVECYERLTSSHRRRGGRTQQSSSELVRSRR